MKKILVGLTAVIFVLSMAIMPTAAYAQIPIGGAGTLGDLFVLSNLFGMGVGGFTTLGDVFVLDQLFGGPIIGGGPVAAGGPAGGAFGGPGTLGDLFVMANLFGIGPDGFVTLGDVFVLDQLFGGPIATPF